MGKNFTTEGFANKIYELVALVPKGKVTTYKSLAICCGKPNGARLVGWILSKAPEGLPCHRVVNRNGELTGKFAFGSSDLMKELLISEGIEFDFEKVKMEKHFWDF
ncbi:MGMT family protein [bacterium]|nr:MGMT family protein [bacterium]